MTVAAALTPLVAVLILLVALRLSAARAMGLSLVLTVLVAVIVWEVPARRAAAAALEGLAITATILWILFGAIFLLKVLTAGGALEAIRAGFVRAAPDPRAQVVLVAWLFGAFLEGAAGFGTPAAVTAPLMVALGVPPLGAATLALVADSSPVSFGAVGTPVLVGLAQGLQEGGELAPFAAAAVGERSLAEFLQAAAVRASAVDLAVGSFIPLVLVLLLTRFFRPERSWRAGLGAWRFALFAGFAFTLPALGVAALLGPEFPSILGALVGLALVAPAARRGLWLGPPLAPSEAASPAFEAAPAMPLSRAWAPYLLLVALLVATRVVTPLKAWLLGATLSWPDILGAGVAVSAAPLYSPGAAFVVVALAAARLHRLDAAALGGALRETGGVLLGAALALGAAVPMVRVFIQSGVNGAGLASMPLELAAVAAEALGPAWPLVAPLIGALGAFLSGSATFSNMMFALLQLGAAERSEASGAPVLAAQMLGANAGNMVSVLNVVAAAAVVGLLRREGDVIRFTLGPMLAYVVAAGGLVFALGAL